MTLFMSAPAKRRATTAFTTLGALFFVGMVLTAVAALLAPAPAKAVPTVEASAAISATVGSAVDIAGRPTTVPASLSGMLSGSSVGTTPSEGAPSLATPTPSAEIRTSKWWWIPLGIATLAALVGVLRLLTRGGTVQQPAELVKPPKSTVRVGNENNAP